MELRQRSSIPVSERPIDILLVEDQPHDAELALRSLEELDLDRTVRHVRDGTAALDLLLGSHRNGERSGEAPIDEGPKLILLDLKLPKKSGIEILKALKSDERTRDIPVVILTSSREMCDIEDAYALGANSYVVKPVDFVEFREAVQRIGTYWLHTNEPMNG